MLHCDSLLAASLIFTCLLNFSFQEIRQNSLAISARDYQQSICAYRCNGTARVNLNELNGACYNFKTVEDLTCFPCQCERPLCELLTTCCPDIGDNFYNDTEKLKDANEVIVSNANSTTSFPQIFGPHQLNTSMNYGWASKKDFQLSCPIRENAAERKKYWCVKSCSNERNEFITTRLCHNDTEYQDSGTYAYAIDKNTTVPYCNKYCAQCNNVSDYVTTRLDVTCSNYIRVYTAKTEEELFLRAVRRDSYCSIEQVLEESSLHLPECDAKFDSDVIRTCGLPGQSSEVVAACGEYQKRHYQVLVDDYYNTTVYANIFCAICNLGLFPTNNGCTHPTYGPGPLPMEKVDPLSFLVGFSSRGTAKEEHSCNATEWAAPNGECFPISCSLGKNLVNNTCVTAMTQVTGLGYTLDLWLIPSDFGLPADVVNDFLENKIGTKLILDSFYEAFLWTLGSELVLHHELEYGAFTERHENKTISLTLWAKTTLIAQPHVPRDEFENTIIESFINSFIVVNISSDYKNYTSIYLNSFVMDNNTSFLRYEDILKRDQVELVYNSLHKNAFFIDSSSESYARYPPPPDWSNPDIPWTYIFELKVNEQLYLSLQSSLLCPFVVINSNHFQIETKEKIYNPLKFIRIRFGENQLYVANNFDLNKIDYQPQFERVLICKEFFIENRFTSQEESSTGWLTIFTILCFATSEACLLCTLTTYAIFPSLRTMAGINNMALSASLALALLLLLASFHVTGPSHVCTILGVATHFMWLWHFCCGFICCYHMFRVFTAKTRKESNKESDRKTLQKRALFTVLVPAVIVTTVVVTSHVTSEGKDMGYGKSSCYLDSTLLVVAAMVTPLLVATLLNTYFFVVTVRTIHNIRQLQTDGDKQQLVTYVKLSTITGITWLLFLLADAANSLMLKAAAILLIGLQGAAIFLSYVCNRHVMQLYRAKVKGRQPTAQGSTRPETVSKTTRI